MAFSRRNFLAAGRSLLAAAALPIKFFGAASPATPVSPGAPDLALSTRGTFLPLVNSSFAVHSGVLTRAWLTLLAVQDMNSEAPQQTPRMAVPPKAEKNPAPRTDTFALHFQGTGETLLQGTYDLEHNSFGKFSLFLVPSGISSYTAIISHIQSAIPIHPPGRIHSKLMKGDPVTRDNS